MNNKNIFTTLVLVLLMEIVLTIGVFGIWQKGGVVQFGVADFNRIESGVTNDSVIVATTTATLVLSANSGRVYAEICNNDSSNSVWLHLTSATGSVAINEGFHLQAGECYTINPDNLYIGQIYGLASGGEVVVSTVEK